MDSEKALWIVTKHIRGMEHMPQDEQLVRLGFPCLKKEITVRESNRKS